MKNKTREQLFAQLSQIKSKQIDLATEEKAALVELRDVLIAETPTTVEEGIEQAQGILSTTEEIETVDTHIQHLSMEISALSIATLATMFDDQVENIIKTHPLGDLLAEFVPHTHDQQEEMTIDFGEGVDKEVFMEHYNDAMKNNHGVGFLACQDECCNEDDQDEKKRFAFKVIDGSLENIVIIVAKHIDEAKEILYTENYSNRPIKAYLLTVLKGL